MVTNVPSARDISGWKFGGILEMALTPVLSVTVGTIKETGPSAEVSICGGQFWNTGGSMSENKNICLFYSTTNI